jgi:hypothetical protein
MARADRRVGLPDAVSGSRLIGFFKQAPFVKLLLPQTSLWILGFRQHLLQVRNEDASR